MLYDFVSQLSLGYKVLVFWPFIAIGLGIGYAALAIDTGPSEQIALRVFVLLMGGMIGSIAFISPFL